MSIQSVGNTLSPQQILQMLQQQSAATADPEAAGADGANAVDPTGQNLPVDPAQAEDSAASGGQVAPAKATLDPATIKALLQVQEQQTQAAEDVYLFGTGGSTGDPLLDAIAGNGNSSNGQSAAPTSLLDALNAEQNNGKQTDQSQTDVTQAAMPQFDPQELSAADPAQIQAMLAAMTGSATSGNSIANITQSIMTMLGGSDPETVPSSELAKGVTATSATEE